MYSVIECKKSREQRCNEQAIKIFISRGQVTVTKKISIVYLDPTCMHISRKEAFVDDIWEFQVSMVFSMLMYGGNCLICKRISG
uniref:Uncharacterized protein n=1 Tax=Lactuca sativa TaxID=4236 RepID=A0A9R1WZW9_LACSA|nr:hypothetical protein LSAT_V11C800454400 [Lactuca sativa]